MGEPVSPPGGPALHRDQPRPCAQVPLPRLDLRIGLRPVHRDTLPSAAHTGRGDQGTRLPVRGAAGLRMGPARGGRRRGRRNRHRCERGERRARQRERRQRGGRRGRGRGAGWCKRGGQDREAGWCRRRGQGRGAGWCRRGGQDRGAGWCRRNGRRRHTGRRERRRGLARGRRRPHGAGSDVAQRVRGRSRGRSGRRLRPLRSRRGRPGPGGGGRGGSLDGARARRTRRRPPLHASAALRMRHRHPRRVYRPGASPGTRLHVRDRLRGCARIPA